MSSAMSGGDVFGHTTTSKGTQVGSYGYQWSPEYLQNIQNVMQASQGFGTGPQGLAAFMQPNNPLFQPSQGEQQWLGGIQDYARAGQDPQMFQSRFIDPLSQSYGKVFSDVVGPELKNYLQVQGQGDSGAFGEYAQRYASSVAPSIESQGWQRYIQGLGPMSAGLGAAAQPRLGSMANFMNAEQLTGNTLLGSPAFMGGQTFGRQHGMVTQEANMSDQFGGIMSMLGSIAMIAAAA